MVWKKRTKGGKEPKSVACNEMNAEGMMVRPEMYAYIYVGVYTIFVCLLVRVRV